MWRKLAAAAVAAAAFVGACKAEENPDATDGHGQMAVAGACETPNEGCDCETPGLEVDCGQVKNIAGDYVSCSMGKRVCGEDGRWGACAGSHIVTKSVPGIATSSITQGACPTTGSLSNPCDPYCHQAVEADAGITLGNGGAMVPGGPACEYHRPADPNATYTAIPSSYRALPASCTSGTNDTCGHDSYCSGGKCEFFVVGQKNSAASSFDLVAETPCMNGTEETIAICNRGNAPANTGVLHGVVQEASLVGRPTNVTLYKSLGGGIKRGTCFLDLGQKPLLPGQCISMPLATFCPGADFDGGTGLRTIQFNMPDWGGSDPPRIAGESLTRNNYTVYAAGALLACAGVGCAIGGAPPSPTFKTTATGLSACTPGSNAVASSCNASNRYTACQQDHRCDLDTQKCVWNGGEGYYDPTVPGVDLTIGAACAATGEEYIPVCNRGSGTVPADTELEVSFFSSKQANACNAGVPACAATVGKGGLGPGKCMSIKCTIPTNKYAIVSGYPEASGLCANNQAFVRTTGTAGCAACVTCDTRVVGKVYDPSGASPTSGANNLPLAGVTVFQPSGALTKFTDGVACDSCASLDSPSITKSITDASGAFTLYNVTPGNTRIVVQSGRWRREITVPVSACVTNQPAAGTFRMPRNQKDGNGNVADIPKIAIVTGNQESLACLMAKIGITHTGTSSEMKGRSSPSNTNRIQIWRDNGMKTSSPSADEGVDLFSQATLDEYTAVIMECGGGEGDIRSMSNSKKNAALAYANKGGRLFLNHWSAEYLVRDTSFGSTSTWVSESQINNQPDNHVRVQTGTDAQQLFYDWLENVGASNNGWMSIAEGRTHSKVPNASTTTEWIRGHGNWGPPGIPNHAGAYNMSYSFETPIGGTCSAFSGTGRVVVNSMHVSPARGSTGTFPTSCSNNIALTAEEKALVYQLFQLTACQLGGAPQPAPLTATTITREVEATCPVGYYPEWRHLRWQSVTPAGTSIDFRVGTADTFDTLPASPPAASPVTVAVGTASGATVAEPSWASDAQTVGQHLANAGVDPRKRFLRVFITIKPTPTVSPTLSAWRQDYSCIPKE